jgi:cytochrome c oxidase subunit 3
LGVAFLGIKGTEYFHKYEEHYIPFRGMPLAYSSTTQIGLTAFLNLYFLMTGLHAFHMILGIGMLSYLIILAVRRHLPCERSVLVHNIGLYWHFVDLVWVYLFPFFYLVT